MGGSECDGVSAGAEGGWVEVYRTDGGCRLQKKLSELLLCCFLRAQDQASMQLSEMEDEMDHRIHAAERKTREQVRPGHMHVCTR